MTKYPLTWPAGWRRTPATSRSRAKFISASKQPLSVSQGTDRVLMELKRLGAVPDSIIVSTNLVLRVDGFPRSDQREPADPGVAVYWKGNADKIHKSMPIDRYDRIADNLAAIAATLEAFRTVERHGGSMVLERAFTGFTALPSPNDWRDVMGFKPAESVTIEQLRDRYRKLALARHPDTETGSHAAMAQLNSAQDQAEAELVRSCTP